MFYDAEKRKYVDVGTNTPLPVTLMGEREQATEDETVTVTVHRNSQGDTTQVIEHSDVTGKTTTTNFTYVDGD